ncbi:MAG: glucose-6-phosphate dehydrogenase [Spirochaetales bacterium]|nr:glucose-6-phosphate dehydrogenase [Spirochaetales bacterium]
MQKNPLSEGLTAHNTPEPFVIVIFGASGDLSAKKLIPALFSLFTHNHIIDFTIVGFARSRWSSSDFKEKTAALIHNRFGTQTTEQETAEFLKRIHYISAPYDTDEGYTLLKKKFAAQKHLIYYLATPPHMYEPIISQLGKNRLTQSADSTFKIVVEKPFGHDVTSAKLLNSKLLSIFKETQVYRIDHYLGKETVQNIIVFRFGNGIYEPIWNNRYIDHVQITVAEKAGIEMRGSYYENAGAIRDMVQNHLLQLLCMVAMEAPNDLEPDSIRNEKVKVLKALRPITVDSPQPAVIRAQYRAGIIDGEKVKAYRKEDKVDPHSIIETYVCMRLFIDTWRWSGVPFFLRTGKRLSRRLTEISIQFKTPPHLLFGQADSTPISPNTLTLTIQPDEGITFRFNSKLPGFTTKMRAVNMNFTYGSSFAEKSPDAYERLLLDMMLNDATLFTRNDEIEQAWKFVSQLISCFKNDADKNLFFYNAGSAGPEEAHLIMTPYNSTWRKL